MAMKKKWILILIIFPLLMTGSAWAQKEGSPDTKLEFPPLYLSVGAGYAKDFKTSIGASGNLILYKGWGIGVGIKAVNISCIYLPADFHAGVQRLWLFTWDVNAPVDNTIFTSLYIIKEFPTKTKRIRLGVEAGPGLVRLNTHEFTKFTPTERYTSNYTYADITKKAVGLSVRLKAKFEFPDIRIFGCEVALFSSLNPYKNLYGAEFCCNLGWVRSY